MNVSRRQLLALTGAGIAIGQASKLTAATKAMESTGLKAAFQDNFLIGAALNVAHTQDQNHRISALINKEFNSITPENCMKWGVLRDVNGEWNWKDADTFVDFGTKHKLHMVGHTLVWHSQIQDEVFKKADGSYLSKAALQQKMEQHIRTLAGRYKGKLAAWDVVNEAVGDDNKMRESHWYKIMGDDFIYNAFELAHETDPQAHLMYNDYNNEQPEKREATINMIKRLQKRGIPIHGLGIQAHLGLQDPPLAEIEKSIIEYAKLGLRVHFTELDIDVLPSIWKLPVAEISTRFDYTPERDPYTQGLPQEMEEKLAKCYEDLFKIFIKHSDKIDRVTFWGISDDASWLNDFPIRGRTNYPLLFDREQQPKKAYFRLLDLKR
jgi:endo-1,4-beta-xylanase